MSTKQAELYDYIAKIDDKKIPKIIRIINVIVEEDFEEVPPLPDEVESIARLEKAIAEGDLVEDNDEIWN